nr:amino acid deaminase [Microbacterium hydrocarbonoxydans]
MSELDVLLTAARRAQHDSPDAASAAIDGLPWLAASIDDDRAQARFDAWGLSTVIDENVGAPVISRSLFVELHRRAGIEAAWPIGNAGLLHCYGYLLSLIETPYGFKRDRWIGGTLAAACDLSPDAFLPWQHGRTLLERARAAADGILTHAAASATMTVDGRSTHLGLSRPHGDAALAYAVAAAADSPPLLITLFPVSDAHAVHAEFATVARLRWNAA